jgi:hypothetical protein
MKILHFTDGGFWLYYRVLEAGSFEALKQPPDGACVTIDATELSMLLSGVSLADSRHRRKLPDAAYAARPRIFFSICSCALVHGSLGLATCNSRP